MHDSERFVFFAQSEESLAPRGHEGKKKQKTEITMAVFKNGSSWMDDGWLDNNGLSGVKEVVKAKKIDGTIWDLRLKKG